MSPLPFLGFQLGKLAQALERDTLQRLGRADLDARHLGVLMLACRGGAEDLSQQALGARLGVDRTTMGKLAARLEALGLVQRERDPEDRRTLRLRGTEEGQALAAAATQRIVEIEEALLEALDKQQRATFAAAVRRLYERLEEPQP